MFTSLNIYACAQFIQMHKEEATCLSFFLSLFLSLSLSLTYTHALSLSLSLSIYLSHTHSLFQRLRRHVTATLQLWKGIRTVMLLYRLGACSRSVVSRTVLTRQQCVDFKIHLYTSSKASVFSRVHCIRFYYSYAMLCKGF